MLPGCRQLLIERPVRTPVAERRQRMPFTNRKGVGLHLGLSCSVLRDADGRPGGRVVIFQDLTQVVRMELLTTGCLHEPTTIRAVGRSAQETNCLGPGVGKPAIIAAALGVDVNGCPRVTCGARGVGRPGRATSPTKLRLSRMVHADRWLDN